MFDLAGAPVAIRIPCTSILSSLASKLMGVPDHTTQVYSIIGLK